VADEIFHSSWAHPTHLAYVEWFSPFSAVPEVNHHLYKVTRSMTRDGHRSATIIPVESILYSVHLLPNFGPSIPQHWDSSSVLDEYCSFFVNPFSDRENYLIISEII